MTVNLQMEVIHAGKTINDVDLPVGMKVTYHTHLIGGMVNIKLPNGDYDIADPRCFKELRT